MKAIIAVILLSQILVLSAFAQNTDSPFERSFGDVKFLDAYFGTEAEKMEIEPGDRNVPFTVVLANVGTQDISGIRGQLSLPLGFTSAAGAGSLIYADTDSNALAGENFALTFFVNVGQDVQIRQYPATIKIDFSRLRESGTRNSFFDFEFKVTGFSLLNMRALDPFLVSLKNNEVIVELSNAGTAPLSGVEVILQNTASTISSTSQSISNVENVVFDQNNWKVGSIDPKSSKLITFNVYVPDNLKNAVLHAPMDITFFDAHGERKTVSRSVDFYVSGLIETSIYNVQLRQIGERQLVIGEILNEGNTDGLFAFVTLEPREDSNIKEQTQYIDELEPDSPVPFNIPIEFDGEPRVGKHDIRIIVKYKDSVRNEHVVTHDTTIDYQYPPSIKPDFDILQLSVIAAAVGVGIFAAIKLKKRKQIAKQTS
ncbi:MAG: hypothetical protein Q8O65_04785 [Nitrosopumilaceae archaeon]|nr:hypothetical protein [Nitrosopumilaceae archaeon]